MVYIESAFLGDEKTARNVTKVILDKITGTSIKTKVDDKLIPAFDVVEKTEITDNDDKKLKEQAVKECGEANQSCIDQTLARLRTTALQARAIEDSDAAPPLKGKRLTVNLVDEQGNRKRILVPDGKDFELNDLSKQDPRKKGEILPSVVDFQKQFIEITTTVFTTFTWAFSVAATYALFARLGWFYTAIGLSIIAIILPWSGYVIIFLYFAGKSFVDNYVSMD